MRSSRIRGTVNLFSMFRTEKTRMLAWSGPILWMLSLAGTPLRAGGPANDNCAEAFDIGDGMHTGTNVGATTDATASCGFHNNPGFRDIWWRYTAPVTGSVLIDSCGSDFDTLVSIYSDCGERELACNDDKFDVECLVQASLRFVVSAGESYLIRVAGWSSQTGTVWLEIVSEECGNGLCGAFEDASFCPRECTSLADLAHFQNCFMSQDDLKSSECTHFDLDDEPGVNLRDFDIFLDRRFVGP